jgi:ribonuclease HII
MATTRNGLSSAKEIAALLSDAPEEEAREMISRYADDPRKQVQKAVASAAKRLEKAEAERARVQGMYDLQREMGGDGIVLGVDEVGRGSIAGPLTVCAVALPYDPVILGINDSKQLTPARREVLAAQIADVALAIGTCHIEPASIDAVGMAQALRLAMSGAIKDAGVEPDCVLIDGNPMHLHPKEKTLVKGDARIAAIAAASIVAKVTRDHIMIAYDEEYPEYHLAECKGYASADHIAAIKAHGLTPIHRFSFCGNFLETPALF